MMAAKNNLRNHKAHKEQSLPLKRLAFIGYRATNEFHNVPVRPSVFERTSKRTRTEHVPLAPMILFVASVIFVVEIRANAGFPEGKLNRSLPLESFASIGYKGRGGGNEDER
jgi:hypothetical protein